MTTIHHLLPAEKPRERLVTHGISTLSDTELLAVILTTSGVCGLSVLDVARNLLKKGASIRGIAALSLEQLQEVLGIGKAKSSILAAVFELARRYSTERRETLPVYTSAKELADLLMPRFRSEKREQMWVLLFDSKQQLIKEIRIADGGMQSIASEPREIFEEAILKRASSIILAHNHPSGDPTPSEEDIFFTKEIIKAGNLMRIPVLDHLILSSDAYVSLAERRII